MEEPLEPEEMTEAEDAEMEYGETRAVEPEETAEAAVIDPGYAIAERVRSATFKQARRGYDRREVDEFLAELADELRSTELGIISPADDYPEALRREVQKVGESTASILRAAEQSARELRGGARRDAEELRRSAAEESSRLRQEAEDAAIALRDAASEEAGRLRLQANEEAAEAVRSAQTRAESLVADAIQRRRLLEGRIERLLERREVLLEDLGRLATELHGLARAEADDELLPAENADVEGASDGAPGLDEADTELADEPLPDER